MASRENLTEFFPNIPELVESAIERFANLAAADSIRKILENFH